MNIPPKEAEELARRLTADQIMTMAEWEAVFAAVVLGVPVQLARELGWRVVQCACGASDCMGWRAMHLEAEKVLIAEENQQSIAKFRGGLVEGIMAAFHFIGPDKLAALFPKKDTVQ